MNTVISRTTITKTVLNAFENNTYRQGNGNFLGSQRLKRLLEDLIQFSKSLTHILLIQCCVHCNPRSLGGNKNQNISSLITEAFYQCLHTNLALSCGFMFDRKRKNPKIGQPIFWVFPTSPPLKKFPLVRRHPPPPIFPLFNEILQIIALCCTCCKTGH